MASVAEWAAATYLQKLYNNTEEDKLRDFELVSRDGYKFRVHSLLLQHRFSNVIYIIKVPIKILLIL